MLPYPYPQTAGRDRHVETVDQSTFEGLPFRPTQTQAESMFRTNVYADNDWYETPFALQFSEQANREESRAKAAAVGGDAGGGVFAGLWDVFKDTTEKTFASIADDLMVKYGLKVQSVTPGSSVPGNPPAPGEINYTAAQREQVIKERVSAGSGIFDSVITQVKGLFNLGYPSPYETKTGGIPAGTGKLPANIGMIAVGILILYMVTR